VKSAYCEEIATLDNVKKFLGTCYLSLEAEDIKTSKDCWLITCSTKYYQVDGNTGPIKPAWMIFDSEGKHSFEVPLKASRQGLGRNQSLHTKRSLVSYTPSCIVLGMSFVQVFETMTVSIERPSD